MTANNQRAFTLVEMAVVLTIIGLIVGGIMVGRDLIRASQFNAIISEIGHYTQAVNDFRDKYYALPGDFNGATALWGTDTTNGGTCNGGFPPAPAIQPHTATCNGDGNGIIGNINTEEWRAWQHLANAGMIDGGYTGITGSGGPMNSVIGLNVPAAKVPGTGYTMFSMNSPAGTGSDWPLVGVMLMLGKADPVNWTYIPAFTPAEVSSVDAKIDDGLPGFGNIKVSKPAAWPNCATDNTGKQYATSYNGYSCAMEIIIAH